MLKGILEGCLLAIIKRGETYGYEMIEKLEEFGFNMVSEGSIYPVLMRMQKDNLVTTVMKASPNGPNRKYYSITELGQVELADYQARWKELSHAVHALFDHDLNKGVE
ncbi:PadR family transcriptional regulator [Paenisporosarcina antarctica]|uniref:PadR family transcriptional regulator n=1 Tax=Paenisporosarcina antarctica TaxID=417367 RepID=A0A4P7A2H5_9BACL|nr:PadR family transcriptional regulator [Paenisporosarcina antarctica]QBP43057.1 PadR family transcriptional regulator [Paenisporosarcina antarctica]